MSRATRGRVDEPLRSRRAAGGAMDPMDDRREPGDAAGITKVSDGDNLDAGGSQSRAVDLSQPGTYSFVCNLPGHFRSGMVTTFTVAPVLPSAAITLTDFKIGTGSAQFAPGQYDFS